MSKFVKLKMTKDGSGNVLGPNLTLDIGQLLKNFAEETRESELKQVTFVILRNIVLFRKLFSYYCAVGNIKHRTFEEKTSTMTRFQLWRFLKDTKVHHHANHNLASVDRAIASCFSFKDIHNPTDKFGLQDFLKCCVVIGYSIYKSDPSYVHEEANVLSKCMQQFLDDNLLNHSFRVGGQFLYESRRAMKALMYMENSWRVYQYCCMTYSNTGELPRMRQFLFMLRDLDILGKHLSTGTVLKILAFDDPFVVSNESCNMELEMTFLEFFEGLVGCGLCYGFDNMNLMSNRSVIASDVDDLSQLSSDYSLPKLDDDFPVWSKQVQNFFAKVLFPTWHNQQKITRAAHLSRIRSSHVVVQNS